MIRKLREVLARVRPGILAVWTNDGSISHKDTMRCLELMGQEVLPALREIEHELEYHRSVPGNPLGRPTRAQRKGADAPCAHAVAPRRNTPCRQAYMKHSLM